MHYSLNHLCVFEKHDFTLISQESEGDDSTLSPNVIIQLFSPMVTSQRVMSCQFGNSYTFIQCQDGTNMVFDEVCITS